VAFGCSLANLESTITAGSRARPRQFVLVCISEQCEKLDEGKMETPTMSGSRLNEVINRPTACPFCQGKRVDTLAKTITVTTLWRCRECEATWTIASRAASTARSRFSL
jgi:ribosomal protein L37AE/L43A